MGGSMTAGILLGLGAATGQSVSYFCTRLFVARGEGAVLRLLVVGHLLMGAVSVAAMPLLLWGRQLGSVSVWLGPVVCATLLYLLGQAGVFVALRHAQASQTSPLLGLKILVLAVASLALPWQALSPQQWVSAALAVGAAFVMNWSGRLPKRAIVAVALACAAYCGADVAIRCTMDSLASDRGLMFDSLLGVAMCYTLSGILALGALPLTGRPTGRQWLLAAPFAASWLVSMVLLYACFAAIGVVLGNIMLSTRGLLSVVLGAGVAALGMEHLERPLSGHMFARRITAAAMMFASVVLYILG